MSWCLIRGGMKPYPQMMYYIARNGHCKDKYGYPTDAPILCDFVRLRWLKWAKKCGGPLLF